jgi:hypothetical protein
MENGLRAKIKGLWGLLIFLGLLQVTCVGLMVYFGVRSIERERLLLERTGTMMSEVFPGMQGSLSDISDKASDIKGEVSSLKDSVSQMNETVAHVDRGVGALSGRMEGLSGYLSGFVDDTAGIIWGHSLNPYVLIGLLVASAVGIPFWWLVIDRFRKPRSQTPGEVVGIARADLGELAVRLDRLAEAVSQAQSHGTASPDPSPDVAKLMDETQRFVTETREELSRLCQSRGDSDRGSESDSESKPTH